MLSGVALYIVLVIGVLHTLFMAVMSIIALVVNGKNRAWFSKAERSKYPYWSVWIYILSLSSGLVGSILVKHIVNLPSNDVDLLCGQSFFVIYLVIYHILFNVYLLNHNESGKTGSNKIEQ